MFEITQLTITLVLGYFLSMYISNNYANQNNKFLIQMISFIVIIFLAFYLISNMKSGPNRAIFLDSLVFALMIPLFPFICVYNFFFAQKN